MRAPTLTTAPPALTSVALERALRQRPADVAPSGHAMDGRFQVAVGPSVPLDRALAGVAAVARRMPDVAVELQRTWDAERRVAAGVVDIALMRAPVHDRSLSWAVASREPRVALVPTGHPLAGAAHARVTDLRGTEILEPADDALGLGRPIVDTEQLLAGVAAGRAVAVVPRGLAAVAPAALASVPLPTAMPSTIVVVHRAPATAYVDALVEATTPS